MKTKNFFKKYKNLITECAVILAIGLLFRSVVYEPYVVPSGSMVPTLIEGDRILISKFYYGISRYSFPFSPPLFKGRILAFKEPKRGDVIVFEKDKIYVKRLIGLPGDTIQVVDGNLYINGKEITKRKMPNAFQYGNYKVSQYLESLPGGKNHPILDIERYSEFDNTRAFAVPANHYFFMGDNRDDSRDSRDPTGIGFVHRDALLGRVEAIFFSSSALHLYDVFGLIKGFKKERAFTKVQ